MSLDTDSAFGIIAGVFGNEFALRAVLDALGSQGIPAVCSLGNIVGLGPDPAGCIGHMPRFAVAVKGHVDVQVCGEEGIRASGHNRRALFEWTRSALSEEHRSAVSALPEYVLEDGHLFLGNCAHMDEHMKRASHSFVWPRQFDSSPSLVYLGDVEKCIAASQPKGKFMPWRDIEGRGVFPGLVTDMFALGVARYAIADRQGVSFSTARYDVAGFLSFLHSVDGLDSDYVRAVHEGCSDQG